ncbi:MAG: glycosyltransferase family 4 protein [Chloroflexota bacterium]
MAGSARRLGRIARRVVRDPIGAVGAASARPADTAFFVASLVPAPVRKVVAGPLAAVAERQAARPGRHGLSPQLAFFGHWAAGEAEAAAASARRLGTASDSAPRTRLQLASMAFGRGLIDVAGDILDATPDHVTPAAELLRARIALDEGRYTAARRHAGAAAAADGHTGDAATDLMAAIDSRIAVIAPGWQPDLGPSLVRRLEHLRGSSVPGRILHIVFASLPYHQSGYSVRTQAVGVAQRSAGLDPRFATRAGFPRNVGVTGAAPEETVDGVSYYRLSPDFHHRGHRERIVTESASAAVPLVEQLRPAALQAASDHIQAQIALALGPPLGIPVVYEVRGFWEETWASHPWHDQDEARQTDHYRMTRDTETRAMLAADAVVTISDTMRAAILERGCAPEKVVVIPNAVDVDRFRPMPRDDRLAESLGIEQGDAVLGYVSSFNRYEGIRYLLDAAARLRAEGRSVRVLLVGDGKDADALRARGRQLRLDDGTLIMPGRVAHDDVLRYYSIIDVFVVPRTADRVSQLVTPLKPYEAMAMRLPVIVSDLPALREIVTLGETGLTFRAEDPDDLAEVVRRLIDDPELRRRLADQAYEWVLGNRTWEANGRLYRELYERLGAA